MTLEQLMQAVKEGDLEKIRIGAFMNRGQITEPLDPRDTLTPLMTAIECLKETETCAKVIFLLCNDGKADPRHVCYANGMAFNAMDFAISQGNYLAAMALLRACGKPLSTQAELFLFAACKGFSPAHIEAYLMDVYLDSLDDNDGKCYSILSTAGYAGEKISQLTMLQKLSFISKFKLAFNLLSISPITPEDLHPYAKTFLLTDGQAYRTSYYTGMPLIGFTWMHEATDETRKFTTELLKKHPDQVNKILQWAIEHRRWLIVKNLLEQTGSLGTGEYEKVCILAHLIADYSVEHYYKIEKDLVERRLVAYDAKTLLEPTEIRFYLIKKLIETPADLYQLLENGPYQGKMPLSLVEKGFDGKDHARALTALTMLAFELESQSAPSKMPVQQEDSHAADIDMTDVEMKEPTQSVQSHVDVAAKSIFEIVDKYHWWGWFYCLVRNYEPSSMSKSHIIKFFLHPMIAQYAAPTTKKPTTTEIEEIIQGQQFLPSLFDLLGMTNHTWLEKLHCWHGLLWFAAHQRATHGYYYSVVFPRITQEIVQTLGLTFIYSSDEHAHLPIEMLDGYYQAQTMHSLQWPLQQERPFTLIFNSMLKDIYCAIATDLMRSGYLMEALTLLEYCNQPLPTTAQQQQISDTTAPLPNDGVQFIIHRQSSRVIDTDKAASLRRELAIAMLAKDYPHIPRDEVPYYGKQYFQSKTTVFEWINCFVKTASTAANVPAVAQQRVSSPSGVSSAGLWRSPVALLPSSSAPEAPQTVEDTPQSRQLNFG